MNNLVKLNDDCIYNILTFIPAFDVVKCSLINKQFCNVHKSELLWKKLFENTFCHINCDNNFYTNYIKQINIDIRIYKSATCYKNDYTTYNYLDMGNKQISYISQQIQGLSVLDTLHLHMNKLQTIPIYLCKLPNLKTLNLSHNKLKYIPPEIKELCQLQNIFIDNNELISLPTEICDLEHLQWLSIHNNKIQQLPIKIINLKKLKTLFIDYVLKESIPHEILKRENIKITYLRC